MADRTRDNLHLVLPSIQLHATSDALSLTTSFMKKANQHSSLGVLVACMQGEDGVASESRYHQCESWIESRLRTRAHILRPQDPAFVEGVINVHRTYVSLALEGSCAGGATSDPQAAATAAHLVQLSYPCCGWTGHAI